MKKQTYGSPELSEMYLTAELGFAESGTATIYDWGEDDSDELNF